MVAFAAINYSLGIVGQITVCWIIVGLAAGWLAHEVAGSGGGRPISDLAVGVIGAFASGCIFSVFINGLVGVDGSIVVAFISALVLTIVIRTLIGKRSPISAGNRR